MPTSLKGNPRIVIGPWAGGFVVSTRIDAKNSTTHVRVVKPDGRRVRILLFWKAEHIPFWLVGWMIESK